MLSFRFDHGMLDDGSEGGGEIGSGSALKVFGSRRVATGENVASIVKRHLLQGSEEDLFCLRCGLLGGAVHDAINVICKIPLSSKPTSRRRS